MRVLERLLIDAGVELDQRLHRAIEMIGKPRFNDGELFLSLYRLNSFITRYITIDESQIERSGVWFPAAAPVPIGDTDLGDKATRAVFSHAVEIRRSPDTLGTRDFLRAVLELGLRYGDYVMSRPFSIDMLTALAGNFMARFSRVPEVEKLLRQLCDAPDGAEDFQYFLALEGNRVVFRVASVLDDYIQQGTSGLLVPQRAVLTHFQHTFGGFTSEEIGLLDDLLSSESARESDFQAFFERFPHFLRMADYREVYPHVTLERPEGPLVPDFILTDRELQRAAIMELKLPRPRLIRRQHNRDRFASAVMEARAQLLRYRDWFRDRHNRERLRSVVGMHIYEPRMIVVIGRASEFVDEFDRQQLRADNPEIEVVTFDDILAQARRRQLIIRG